MKYVIVQEDYFETDMETNKPRLIHAAGARIQASTARAYGDAIKTKDAPDEDAAPLPFEPVKKPKA